ncbi:MAG: HAD family phosphatase [Chloroflexi bacterium]|nr:HAD family phosphatase [Chloroflexota bacterium]
MQKLTAIIFDMDGLMVDSEPLSHQAWNDYLRPFGHHINDQLVQRMIGLRADVSGKLIRDTFQLTASVEEINAQKAAIYAQIRAQGVPAMPGLMPLHTAIAKRNIPWAIATSSPRHHAEEILHQLQLTPTNGTIACGNEVINGKPAPDIYLLAAKRLGIAPTQCLALEDSGPGSEAAVAAGMLTIAIPNSHTQHANFSHVDYRFNSLHDVLNNLDTLIKTQ